VKPINPLTHIHGPLAGSWAPGSEPLL